MLTLHSFDLVMAALLCLAVPFWGLLTHRHFEANIARGAPEARLAAYRQIMAVEWTLTLIAIGYWLAQGRSLALLGLGFETTLKAWIGTAFAFIGCVLLLVQMIVVQRSDEKLAQVRKQIEPVRDLIPRDDAEATAFRALSITAGICEELLYRGFLFALAAALVGTWGAIVVTAVFFGLGHSYQGVPGILRTAAVGLAFGGLYVLSGSLWPPIVLHAVVDLTSGQLGRRALERAEREPDTPQLDREAAGADT